MASEPIPEISFLEFDRRTGLEARRVPLQGTVETTFRCNLSCAHCYVNQPAGSTTEAARELKTEELLRVIDDIVDAGCLFLCFTGGEVLVRSDFPEVYLHAWRRGLLIVVFTNGTMVTDRIADLFAEHRPERIEISLYGMTQATYERVTRVPGSYDKCLAGIERLLDRDLTVELKTVVLSWNRHEVAAMQSYAQSLGVRFRYDSHLNARVDCGANRNRELQTSAAEVVAFDVSDAEVLEDLRRQCERELKEPSAPRENLYSCGAGLSSFTIDPYGQLQMCQLSRKSAFDLRRGAFADGWYGLFPALRERKWQRNDVCPRCTLLFLCNSCPGAAELETGDPEGIVAPFCEITHLRAFAAAGEVAGHRRDATCCLGKGRLAAKPPEEIAARIGGGCGSGAEPAPAPLIQIERRRPRA